MRIYKRVFPLWVAGVIVTLALASSAAAGSFKFFRATLGDAENVPPYTTMTEAQGKLSVRSFRGRLSYTLTVSNLQNAFAAHIHCGAAGTAAPVGVTLFQYSASPQFLPDAAITVNGTIARGAILAPNFANACG